MKKLVLIIVLAFAFNQSEIKAQSIVIPVDTEIGNVIDVNATDIVLINSCTGQTYIFSKAAELFANWNNISFGIYNVEYTINNERVKKKIKIKNNNN